jgi:hypothetical protein
VDHILSELGNHPRLAHRAMSKQEVAAALCRIGNEAGLWTIPEFEISTPSGTRRIDVVWARRERKSDDVWTPVAAFEIEGHNVNSSIRENAESLIAAGQKGARVLAMILFQAGPKGEPWYPAPNSSKTRSEERAESLLREVLTELQFDYRDRVETVLDEALVDRLELWMHSVRRGE